MYQIDEQPALYAVPAGAGVAKGDVASSEEDKALPLPGWLVKLYFIFPIILYIPDAIFNFFVYSDGVGVAVDDNPVLAIGKTALWAFMSVGIVGMAYLLSVLAPWHWVQGHRIQAFFCGVGVVIATAITTWNSLSFRSTNFAAFATDQWAYGIWPELQANHISLTMIIAAVAPPFWGLFWAIVQPTQRKRSLAHLHENHMERMMRMKQDAELKALKADAAATVREAQLRGMAQTAAAAREQAGVVASQWRASGKAGKGGQGAKGAAVEAPAVVDAPADAQPATQAMDAAPSAPGAKAGGRGRAGAATPRVQTLAFRAAVRKEIGRIEAKLQTPTPTMVAEALGESEADIAPIFEEIMRTRLAESLRS